MNLSENDERLTSELYEVFPFKYWWFGKRRWGVYLMNSAGRSLIEIFDTKEDAEKEAYYFNNYV